MDEGGVVGLEMHRVGQEERESSCEDFGACGGEAPAGELESDGQAVRCAIDVSPRAEDGEVVNIVEYVFVGNPESGPTDGAFEIVGWVDRGVGEDVGLGVGHGRRSWKRVWDGQR